MRTKTKRKRKNDLEDRNQNKLYLGDKVKWYTDTKRTGRIMGFPYYSKGVFVHWNDSLTEENPYNLIRI